MDKEGAGPQQNEPAPYQTIEGNSPETV